MNYDKRKQAEDRFAYRSRNCSWDCWTWGTIFGIGGGIAVVACGSVLTAVAWFEGRGSYAGTVGTFLLLAMLPLLVVGVVCLDIEERKTKQAKAARRS